MARHRIHPSRPQQASGKSVPTRPRTPISIAIICAGLGTILVAIMVAAPHLSSVASTDRATEAHVRSLDSVNARSQPTKLITRETGDLRPCTLNELLALSHEDLARVDLLRMNLLCAEGLPGTVEINIEDLSRRLDYFVLVVQAETTRHLYRVSDLHYADHYRRSETYFRSEMLCQTLSEHFGMQYDRARFWNPDFADPGAQFLHGLLDPADPGGTCVSIPTLIAAAGRRLGYPIRLALAREHVFARWDGPGDRNEHMTLNIESSGEGFDSYTDEFYKRGPSKSISDRDLRHREFLVSLTHAEELAIFLAARGHCFYDNRMYTKALEAYRLAAVYAPTFETFDYFVKMTKATLDGRLDHFFAYALANQPAPSPPLTPEEQAPYLWKP
jgi:hypothetical protein